MAAVGAGAAAWVADKGPRFAQGVDFTAVWAPGGADQRYPNGLEGPPQLPAHAARGAQESGAERRNFASPRRSGPSYPHLMAQMNQAARARLIAAPREQPFVSWAEMVLSNEQKRRSSSLLLESADFKADPRDGDGVEAADQAQDATLGKWRSLSPQERKWRAVRIAQGVERSYEEALAHGRSDVAARIAAMRPPRSALRPSEDQPRLGATPQFVPAPYDMRWSGWIGAPCPGGAAVRGAAPQGAKSRAHVRGPWPPGVPGAALPAVVKRSAPGPENASPRCEDGVGASPARRRRRLGAWPMASPSRGRGQEADSGGMSSAAPWPHDPRLVEAGVAQPGPSFPSSTQLLSAQGALETGQWWQGGSAGAAPDLPSCSWGVQPHWVMRPQQCMALSASAPAGLPAGQWGQGTASPAVHAVAGAPCWPGGGGARGYR